MKPDTVNSNQNNSSQAPVEQNSSAKQNMLSGTVGKELDFYRIRDGIAALCASEEGKSLLLQRESISDSTKINELKNTSREWHRFLTSAKATPLASWPPVKEIFPILGVEGTTLLTEQVFSLGIFCQSVEKIKAAVSACYEELDLPKLYSLTQKIPSLNAAKNEIFAVVDAEGKIKELPALREIRSKISRITKEIENAIRKYTSDSSLNGVLQSNVPAFRADRQVLAVRSDRRSSIKGIVHEVSSSGQTVYIEPDEVVRANNDLVQAEYELDAEIRNILKDLTARLSVYKKDFEDALEVMLFLDTTYASARYQAECKGIFAEECDMSIEPPVLLKARHPLLGDKAVPIDIHFHDGKKVLIITGPNTGGKTVTLKTFALFCLLNQAGFPIPAEEGTRLPIFDSIFADIGDEQSIDQSLSTFSSHMKKIAFGLENATSKSLVLLDELGSGTDPQEGGAIGMAVLDELLAKDAFVLVTTHHGILKNYGYTHEKCINASVEFNTKTLSPTYRLLMGIPGESHALEIASHSGLSKNTVDMAKHYIATEQADVSSLIKGLTKKHAELDRLKAEQELNSQKIEQQSFKLHSKEAELLQKEVELKEMEHSKSTKFLEETRRSLENLVRELREGEITREKTLGVKKYIAELTDAVNAQQDSILEAEENLLKQQEALEKEKEILSENGIRIGKSSRKNSASSKKTKSRASNKDAFANATASVPEGIAKAMEKDKKKKAKQAAAEELLKFEPGAQVLAGRQRRKGVLVAEVKKGVWSVQFGSLKMNMPQTQLMLVRDESSQYSSSVIIESSEGDIVKSEAPVFELRLLGMRYEEAMKAVERQLDLCAVHNFRNFSIIHGKGSGILQQAVHDYLSHYPGVKSFKFAPPEDGGTGKTYVTLI